MADWVGLPPAKRGALRDLDDESLRATSAFKPTASRLGSHPSPDLWAVVMVFVRNVPGGWGNSQMAELAGVPGLVGFLVISWDSLDLRIYRVGQNEVWRQVSLSEIRRKNPHSVPVWMMSL
jgi:hypothetical protein